MAPEGGPIAGTVVHEFRSDEMGRALRQARRRNDRRAQGAAACRCSGSACRRCAARARPPRWSISTTSIARRAEKAGIIYVDIWDGFVDDGGNYNNYGPDFEGQTRRLRTGDGVHFTRAGARKLAHYVEREIRRVMLARSTPVATPAPQEPEPEAEKAPPDGRRARLAAASDREPGDVADRAARRRRHAARRRAGAQHLGRTLSRQRVLVKGEAIEAPAGRADDFAWPRRDVVTATGVLPPDPVEPPPRRRQPRGGDVARGAVGAAAAPAQAGAPRRAASGAPSSRRPDGSLGADRNYEPPRQNQAASSAGSAARW